VRLAGEDDLERPPPVVEHPLEALAVPEDQVGPLVGGKAPREPDGEDRGVEQGPPGEDFRRADAVPRPALPDTFPHGVDELDLEPVVGFPEILVGNLRDVLPDGGVVVTLDPVGTEPAVEEQLHLRLDPRGDVNPIGDGVDGNSLRSRFRPEALPHPAGHLAVAQAHAVAEGRELQRHDGHVEAGPGVRRVDAETEELVAAQAEGRPVGAEVLFHQVEGEDIVAGGNGRVGREDGRVAHLPRRLLEGKPLVLDFFANPLQERKRRVPLVEVQDRAVDAQGVEHLVAADPQDDLLAQPQLPVADVEALRDAPVPGVVRFNVRVHEIQGNPAHVDLPDRHMDGGLDEGNLDDNLPSLGVKNAGDGGRVAVEGLVHALLPAVVADVLHHVPLGVHEPHGDQRDPQVAGLLDVVPGQEPQPARVEGKRVVKAVFGREVGHRVIDGNADLLVAPAVLLGELLPEALEHRVVPGQVCRIGRGHRQRLRREFAQHFHGIVGAFFPDLTIEILVEHPCRRVPAPPEVGCNLREPRQAGRQVSVFHRLRFHGMGLLFSVRSGHFSSSRSRGDAAGISQFLPSRAMSTSAGSTIHVPAA